MATQHTPGLLLAREVDPHHWEVYSEDYGTVATLHAAYGVEAQREVLEGDAHRLAAAPALLAALREIVSDWDAVDDCAQVPDEINNDEHWEAARAAIAQAKAPMSECQECEYGRSAVCPACGSWCSVEDDGYRCAACILTWVTPRYVACPACGGEGDERSQAQPGGGSDE